MASATKGPSIEVLLSWLDTVPPELAAEIGDPSTADGFQKAMDAFLATNEVPKEKREHTARPYRVIILNATTGTYEDRGTHLGSPGRAPSDPSKFTSLQKEVASAKVAVHMLKRKGQDAEVVTLLVDSDS
jgi:hypothetical protein